MEKPESLMDIDEVAAYLHLSKQTLYNWLNRGKFTGIKIGHVWRFRKNEIDKWLEARLQKAVEDER